MSTPGERLREERTRLGLSQEQFGALGGVRKQAQIKYEKGDRKPDSAYFEGIADAGADVGYILTGQPTAPGERKLEFRLQALKTSTDTVQEMPELPKRKRMLIRDLLFGIAIRDSSLVSQTIDNYVEEERAAYSADTTRVQRKGVSE